MWHLKSLKYNICKGSPLLNDINSKQIILLYHLFSQNFQQKKYIRIVHNLQNQELACRLEKNGPG